jgi:hypothetical protein
MRERPERAVGRRRKPTFNLITLGRGGERERERCQRSVWSGEGGRERQRGRERGCGERRAEDGVCG